MTTPAMPTPATGAPAPTAPTAAPTTTAPAPGRLPNGERRRQVAEVLAAHAGTELTPRDIAAALGGKSSGAIGNALAALTGGGYAEQTSTKPVRYRSTPTTADAAAAPVAVPSGAPRRPRAPRPTPPAAAPTPPAPTAAPTVTGPVTRPNGQLYHPRKLSGLPDVTALRKLRNAGVAALMYGPPGTGKIPSSRATINPDPPRVRQPPHTGPLHANRASPASRPRIDCPFKQTVDRRVYRGAGIHRQQATAQVTVERPARRQVARGPSEHHRLQRRQVQPQHVPRPGDARHVDHALSVSILGMRGPPVAVRPGVG